ncbi:MAG: C25 family cysteine peptidase, partial [Bacteroidia bacterium]
QRFAGLVQNGNAELMVKAMTSTSDLLLVTDASIKTPRIGAVSMNPLCDPDSGAQMIILTTAALETSARAYAAYKISLGISTKVVFADDVYNGFGYGTVTPLAIQRFCDCAFQRWNTTPGYLLIWADADALTRQSTSNQIPTWGFPASDHTFAAMTDPAATVREMQEPRFAVGRLPIRHDSAGFNYLQKVPVWEIQNNYDWMREAAFMGGGASVGEQSAISLGINNIMDTYGDTILGGDTTCYFQKIGADTISWPDFSCAHPAKGMRYFFGHASSNILDVNLHKIGFYEDSLKPPFMFINGCFGTDFLSENSQAERWISASDRGAAVWMGNTSAGYLSPLKTYSEIFMELFADKMIEEPIGAVMLATTRAYLDSVPGIQTRNHTRQMALLGDPSLILSRRDTSGGPDGAMWPGDTNDDQEVSVLDVLNVGLAFGQTGPTRANATLHWSPQYSDDWSTQTSAGTNLKHVDSNGDGLIDSSDVVAIGRNYAETYNKTGWGSFTVGGTPLTISHPAQVNAGDQVSLGLELGTAAQPAAGVYGLAFSLSFDSAQVAAGSWQIDISNSWLGPADSLLIFYKEIREEGKVDIAITRTDQAMVSGYGEIAQLDIVIIDDINKRWDTEFSPLLNQGTIIDNIGTRLPVSDAVETFVTPTYTSVVFPNPADESIFLLPGDNTLSDIQLLSLDGRTVAFPSFVTDRYQFDLADIRPGIYILQFREGNSMQYVKVVKR